jgi:hypothetical protein
VNLIIPMAKNRKNSMFPKTGYVIDTVKFYLTVNIFEMCSFRFRYGRRLEHWNKSD